MITLSTLVPGTIVLWLHNLHTIAPGMIVQMETPKAAERREDGHERLILRTTGAISPELSTCLPCRRCRLLRKPRTAVHAPLEHAIIERPVPWLGKTRRQVSALYEEAFPPNERIPMRSMLVGALSSQVAFSAYYEGADAEAPCGLSYTMVCGRYLYVLFLAVDANVRGMGIGTLILAHLRSTYPALVQVLEIEPLDEPADNHAQRVARLAFYERNGFVRVGYDLLEGDMRYTMLATSNDFDATEFARAVRKATRGRYSFEIIPSAKR